MEIITSEPNVVKLMIIRELVRLDNEEIFIGTFTHGDVNDVMYFAVLDALMDNGRSGYETMSLCSNWYIDTIERRLSKIIENYPKQRYYAIYTLAIYVGILNNEDDYLLALQSLDLDQLIKLCSNILQYQNISNYFVERRQRTLNFLRINNKSVARNLIKLFFTSYINDLHRYSSFSIDHLIALGSIGKVSYIKYIIDNNNGTLVGLSNILMQILQRIKISKWKTLTSYLHNKNLFVEFYNFLPNEEAKIKLFLSNDNLKILNLTKLYELIKNGTHTEISTLIIFQKRYLDKLTIEQFNSLLKHYTNNKPSVTEKDYLCVALLRYIKESSRLRLLDGVCFLSFLENRRLCDLESSLRDFIARYIIDNDRNFKFIHSIIPYQLPFKFRYIKWCIKERPQRSVGQLYYVFIHNIPHECIPRFVRFIKKRKMLDISFVSNIEKVSLQMIFNELTDDELQIMSRRKITASRDVLLGAIAEYL